MSNDTLPPLKSLAAFRAAGRANSFQEGARALNVTPSAISHQIKALEDWLGVALFLRETRAVILTPAGRKFLVQVERAFDVISTSAARLKSTRAKTQINVSALPLFTQSWLIPRLNRFVDLHPDIEVTITTGNSISDLNSRAVDVGIRNLRSPSPGLLCRKLLDIRGVPICAPSLKAGSKPLDVPADLAHHTLIHVSARPEAWNDWFKAQELPDIKPKRSFTVDSVPAALEAAARGVGVALGMHPLFWEAEVAKGLITAMKAKPSPGSAYYVAYAKANQRNAAVIAFVTWLCGEMDIYKRSKPGRSR